MNYEFNLKQGFRIGELIVRMYENEFKTQLFDSSSLDELINENNKNSDTNNTSKEENIIYKVEGPHVFFEEVNVNGNSKKTLPLVDEEGLYQIIMLMDTPKARKIREILAKLLVEYRERHKLDVYDFLVQCEKQTIKLGSHIHSKLEEVITPEYDELKEIGDEIIIHNVETFPTYKGKLIKDENDEDYINNIDKSNLESKIEYFIDLDKVISLLVEVFNIDSRVLIEIAFDTVDVYERNGKYYIDGNKDLMKIIFSIIWNNIGQQTEKVRDESIRILKLVLGKISTGKRALSSLFKSTTIYKDIHSSYPYEKQKNYKERYIKLRRSGVGKEDSDAIAKESIKYNAIEF